MNKYYYKDGASSKHDSSRVLHRVDGPALEYTNGDKYWYIDNKMHRIDGPALEYVNGDKYWYIDDKMHRIDGPAVEYADGDKAWYIDGKEFSEREFNKCIEEAKQLPLVLRLIDPREWVRKLLEK